MSYLKEISQRASRVSLSLEELTHFAQNCFLPEVGIVGQKKLKTASVAVVGAGGLGCSVLQGLASSGVGKIRIIDGDRVERTNLARQSLYTDLDLEHSKVEVAEERLKKLNPYGSFEGCGDYLSMINAESYLKDCDLVIDTTDRPAVRQWIDDACFKSGVPWIHGGMYRHDGRLAVLHPRLGLCYEDIFGRERELRSCRELGVLGSFCSVLGNMQVLEAVKWITGYSPPLWGEWMTLNSKTYTMHRWRWKTIPLPTLWGESNGSNGVEVEWESFQLKLLSQQSKMLIHLADPIKLTYHELSTIERQLGFEAVVENRSSLLKADLVLLTCENGTLSRILAEAVCEEMGIEAYSLREGCAGYSDQLKFDEKATVVAC